MTNDYVDPFAIRPKGTDSDKKINLRLNLLGFGFLVLATIVAFRGITIRHEVNLTSGYHTPVRIDLNR